MESGCHPPKRRSVSGAGNGLAHRAGNGFAHNSGNGSGHALGNGAGNGFAHSSGNGSGNGIAHGSGTRPGDVARELISALWERSAPLLTERLHGLDVACEAAVVGRLSPIMRRGAADTAHKLAGSLGMFGYPRGTELAREIEQLLEIDGVVDAVTLRELVVELRASLPL
jgi:HPt (histidine-containing phosphotransfer) domain-containing protein